MSRHAGHVHDRDERRHLPVELRAANLLRTRYPNREMRRSACLMIAGLLFVPSACAQKPPTYRLSPEGYGNGWPDEFSITVAGKSVKNEPSSALTPSLDFPDKNVPSEGTPVEVRFATPCGEKLESFPLPAVRFEPDGKGDFTGRLVIPSSVKPPSRTRVYFDPSLRGDVKLGTLTLHGPKPVEALDLGCLKSAIIGGVETSLPPLKAPVDEKYREPNRPLDDPELAILVTDTPDVCYQDEMLAYGTGKDALGWRKELRGARFYVLAFVHYDNVFQPAAETIKVQGAGTSLTSISRCP